MDDTLNIPGSVPRHPQSAADTANNPDLAASARARLEALFGILNEQTAAPTEQPVTPVVQESAPAQVVAPTAIPAPAAPFASVAPVQSTEHFTLPGQTAPVEVHSANPHQGEVLPTKPVRTMPSRIKPIATAFGAFVLLVLLFKLPVYINQAKFAAQKIDGNAQPLPVVTATVPSNPIISIPKINATAPIIFEPSYDEAKIQKALEGGVVHYGGTPNPGEPGNSVIVGHSSNDWWEPGAYKYVFILLDKMVVGDTYSVNYNSKQYIYQVTEVLVVAPNDLSVLKATTEPTMTLITCTPPGTTWKRLVIKAKQISPTPTLTAVPKPGTTTGVLPGNAPSFWEKVQSFWGGIFGNKNTDPTPQSLPGI